jgi:sec-independent protein translocase protein TatC
MESTYAEHTKELLWRIKHTLVVYVLFSAITLYFGLDLMRLMEGYYDVSVYVIQPLEGVTTYLYFALVLSTILVFPLLLYHVWRFATAELESRWSIYLYLSYSLLLFFMGLSFSVLVNRVVLDALGEYGTPLFGVSAFYEFIGYNTLFTVLIFQIPLAIKGCKKMGIISRQTFSGYRRHLLFATLIITGIITPDASMITQVMLTIPVIVLFEVGLWL